MLVPYWYMWHPVTCLMLFSVSTRESYFTTPQALVSTRPDRDRSGQDDSPMYSVLQNHFAVNLLWTNLFWHLAIFFSAVRESEIESYVMLAKTGMHKKQRMLTC